MAVDGVGLSFPPFSQRPPTTEQVPTTRLRPGAVSVRVAEDRRMRNTQNLKRDAGPGRPKGSKDKVPRTFKASIKAAFEKIASDDPQLVEDAILKGLRGRPREAFHYVQLAAYYLDGKPKEQLEVSGELAMPTIINRLRQSATSDPE